MRVVSVPRLLALFTAAGCAIGCAAGARRVAPAIAPEDLAARLAAADSLAAHGCYLCLRDAAAEYERLLALTVTPSLARKALENDLLIAIRERELRLPDSGAAGRARALTAQSPGADYDAYFSALDLTAAPVGAGGLTYQEQQRRQRDWKALASRFEADWPSSAAAAYFYLASMIGSGQGDELESVMPDLLDAHPGNLALEYRWLGNPRGFLGDVASDILAEEPRFAELRLLLGQRAVLRAQLVDAHQALAAAYETLPDSLSITLTFARLELPFGRYQQSLDLFDRVLARERDESALLGRAIALSYLKRHHDAVQVLDELLVDPRRDPGEKYYWRGWNYLQLAEYPAARDDAAAAMRVMANAPVYKLAGIASYNLSRIPGARENFAAAVKMDAGECDSWRFLGLIDGAERKWESALDEFRSAASCYGRSIERLSADLERKRADTSGLYAGMIPGLLADIEEARSMQQISARNAEIAARNLPAGSSDGPSR